MEENKTSILNQKFDTRTFLIIVKNIWVVVLLILMLGAGFAFIDIQPHF